MPEPNETDPWSKTLLDRAWEDPAFRVEVLSNPASFIGTEADSLFENQPNDLLIFWEKLFG
jgi:hypothetical protein